MNIYNNKNYGDNYTVQAGATVVARSGIEEALARERYYDELERRAAEHGQPEENTQPFGYQQWQLKSKEERMKAAFERMKSEKCQGRSANYFGKGVGCQYAYVLALMRQNDEKYGLPPMDTIKNFLTYLKDFIGLTDLPSEDTICRGINRLSGKYPNWRIENGNQIDVLEAQHVAQRFLSIYLKGE